ncbi:MAG: DUF2589 domain-containing protein [Candidatus Kapaibacterium sp.]
MIAFEQLINVIHGAVLSANDALMQENLRLLDTYFESSSNTDEIRQSLDDALESIENFMFHTRPTKEVIEHTREAFLNAKSALQDEGKQEGASKSLDSLRAKTVTLQYPDQTSSGTIMRNVEVPLITLIPVNMTKVAEVKFKTNLELSIDGNDLKVAFPTPASAPSYTDLKGTTVPSAHTASIEITLTPQESSEGLKKMIEGYERALRSQIPN